MNRDPLWAFSRWTLPILAVATIGYLTLLWLLEGMMLPTKSLMLMAALGVAASVDSSIPSSPTPPRHKGYKQGKKKKKAARKARQRAQRNRP